MKTVMLADLILPDQAYTNNASMRLFTYTELPDAILLKKKTIKILMFTISHKIVECVKMENNNEIKWNSVLNGFMEGTIIHAVAISTATDYARKFSGYMDSTRHFISAYYMLHRELEKGLITIEELENIALKSGQPGLFSHLQGCDLALIIKAELSAKILILLWRLYDLGTEEEIRQAITDGAIEIYDLVKDLYQYPIGELLPGRISEALEKVPGFKEAVDRFESAARNEQTMIADPQTICRSGKGEI